MRKVSLILAFALLFSIISFNCIHLKVSAQGETTTVTMKPSDVSVSHVKTSHPRIIIKDYNDFERLAKLDDYTAGQYRKIKKNADKYLTKDIQKEKLAFWAFCIDITDLVVTYKVEKDKRYLDIIMEFVSKPQFSVSVDANPLVDAAELMALSYVYDWLYDELSVEQKEIVKNDIKAYLQMYKTTAIEPNKGWFAKAYNINNISNASIITAAIAISDEEKAVSDYFLKKCVPNLAISLEQYNPGGGYDEGTAYWIFSSEYLIAGLNAMETGIGHDYGISDLPGIHEMGRFVIHMSGSTGLHDFRYADSPNDRRGYGTPQLFWLAKRFNDPELGYWAKDWCSKYSDSRFANTSMSLLMYDPKYAEFDVRTQELEKTFPGGAETGAMRSAWKDKDALYLAYKGGLNDFGHSQLSAGTFVLGALEQLWVEQVGWEDYGKDGMFAGIGGKQNPRWTLYRNSAQAQNTIVINPAMMPDQNPENHAPIIKTDANKDESYSILNLTPVYDDKVIDAKRGFKIFDSRRFALVQDEVKMEKPSDFWWFVNTRAEINLSNDAKQAILKVKGKKMLVKILSNDDLKFTITLAEPLYSTPSRDDNGLNPGLKRLAINKPNATEVNLAVAFIPLYDGLKEPEKIVNTFTPLSEWNISKEEDSELTEITIGGQPLEQFYKNVVNYNIHPTKEMNDLKINAKGKNDAKVEINQPNELYGVTDIIVAETGKKPTKYVVNLSGSTGKSNTVDGYEAVNVDASISKESKDSLMDDDDMTSWYIDGKDQWIQFDLGQEKDVGAVAIAFSKGETRSAMFDISVSNDNVNWTKVSDFNSSGATSKMEVFGFSPLKARYVRYTAYGNNLSKVTNLSEFRIFDNGQNAEKIMVEKYGKGIEVMDVLVDDREITEGDTVQYKSILLDQFFKPYTSNNIKFEIINDNPDIINVDEKRGTVTALKKGVGNVTFLVDADHYQLCKKIKFAVYGKNSQNVKVLEDTYTATSKPTLNFGSGGSLVVRGSFEEAYDSNSFLKFDLSNVKDKVIKAKLQVYGSYTGSDETMQTIGVYGINDNSWKEGTMIFNNKPEMGALISTANFDRTKKWIEFDVTDYLAKKVDSGGDGLLSFQLHQNVKAVTGTSIASRESKNPPYLILTMEASANVDEKQVVENILTPNSNEVFIKLDKPLKVGSNILSLAMRKGISWVTTENEIGKISIDPGTLKNHLNKNSGIMQLYLKKVDKAQLSQAASQKVGNNLVVETIISMNDVKIRNIESKDAVKATLKLSNDMLANIKQLSVFYIDIMGNLNVVEETSYDETEGTISFEYNKLGKFVIMKK